MCPCAQGNIVANKVGPFIFSIAVALKCDPLVFSANQKLPWIVPVAKDRFCPIEVPLFLFYPKGNRKTPFVKIDYRSSGKGICLVENRSLAAGTTPFNKGRRCTETKIS